MIFQTLTQIYQSRITNSAPALDKLENHRKTDLSKLRQRLSKDFRTLKVWPNLLSAASVSFTPLLWWILNDWWFNSKIYQEKFRLRCLKEGSSLKFWLKLAAPPSVKFLLLSGNQCVYSIFFTQRSLGSRFGDLKAFSSPHSMFSGPYHQN